MNINSIGNVLNTNIDWFSEEVLNKARSQLIAWNELAPLLNRDVIKIEKLDQVETLIRSVDVEKQLKEITTLDLNYMDLTSIPDSIGLLTNLTELNLSFNKLTTLPKTIGQLTNLEKVGLYPEIC